MSQARRGIVRDALGIGIASGAYAVSFGAISTAAGLSVLQTCALSLLMFTGASQFAMVGDIAAFLFPRDAAALLAAQEQLAQSRLWAGIHYQTDIDTGLALGRSVAQAVISARGKIDGVPSAAAAATLGACASG